MTRSRRGRILWGLVAFAVSFVLLAPVECVGYCDDVDATAGHEGGCFSSCTTLLGYAAPLGAGWFLVPVVLVGAAWALRTLAAGPRGAPRHQP